LELELANDRQRDLQLTDWFRQYGRRVLAFVRSKINDFEAAEDAAQDVWLQLTRQPDLGSIEQVGNWLFTAARNRVTDYYRKNRPLPFSQLGLGSSADGDFDGDDSLPDDLLFDHWLEQNLPDSLLESKEFWEELDRALATLPPEQREVFVAHEFEEIPFREMAELTGIPLNTLLARKRYAVLRLREYFAAWLD
jgi:RNA polymerase sigma factor (sigma-70 family)